MLYFHRTMIYLNLLTPKLLINHLLVLIHQ
nr:MAG TPA: hypothetical protein [Bacteriophage sp.]